MNPPIYRQHEDTCIPELYGERCLAFRAIHLANAAEYGLLFIQLSHSWHVFHLDAGLLFWREGVEPDADDDLLFEGEHWVDLGNELQVIGSVVTNITMSDSQLIMAFNNGARIALKNENLEAGAKVVEFTVGNQSMH